MYSILRAPYDLKEIIDTAVKVAAYELGCCLPEIFFVTRDDAGGIKGPQNCNGWTDDRGCFFLIEGRQPHEIARTVFHECSHHCDSLKYGGILSAALADREAAELRAQRFADAMTCNLPIAQTFLLKALQQKLHEQRYPLQHLEAWIGSRRALGLPVTPPPWVEPYGAARWQIALNRSKRKQIEPSDFLRKFEQMKRKYDS
jgi:hypothetical protein